MYQPPHHREDRLDVQHDFIDCHALALLISAGPEGLMANSIPFQLQRSPESLGILQAHMARGNQQWQNIDGQGVLVVFQGPQAYVSPSLYETKRETGKVVPTWNYTMVQVRGVARLRDDRAWLGTQIEALTTRHEGSRVAPWAVSDAPRSFIESQLRGIVGIEVEISAIEGKWKVSQNRPEADRRGVAEGLASSHPDMADIVRRYGSV